MRMNMCAMYIGYYRMRCAWQCDTGSADCACIVWGWLVPQYVLQAVQDTVRLQCMRIMRSWQCLGHYLLCWLRLQCMRMMRACGAGLLTGETGGGGVDEEWTRLSLSAWSRIVLQPPPSSTCCWCKMYFVFLSLYFFPNANYSIQNNCLSNSSLHMQTHPF